MKVTERRRLENKNRKDLVQIIDDLQASLARWKDELPEYDPARVEEPPFYWMIGYVGWGSAEDDVDFINGGDVNPTAQMAVDAWEKMRQNDEVRAYDQDHLGADVAQILVYRIDEVGRASTDQRWVFKPQGHTRRLGTLG